MKSINYIQTVLLSFLFLILGILFSCKETSNNKIGHTKPLSVQLFAATATVLPSNEICNSFESYNNIETERNFAASGALARQIKAGAEADIYISANKQWIDYLYDNKILVENSISEIAYNKLVVICPSNKHIKLEFSKEFDFKSTIIDKIAIGDPKYVPVGKYAKQVLDSLEWYNSIQNKIVLAKDVTSVLHFVEMGECDWGIVYYSEAIKSDKIKIVCDIPQDLYDPIIFYIALLEGNQNAMELYKYFKSHTAKEIFNKYGFITSNI
ncbi:MAG: molybdate ABC transporter substrate-binding protein [Bacteroidales bacterium]|nr:molybdate ABC transporter substrate-binding protein [Bacteroidales bacterium]